MLGGRLTEPLIEKGRKKWQNKKNLVQQEKIMLLISKNANKGTRGTNITYDKNQGNRGKQLNQNQRKGK